MTKIPIAAALFLALAAPVQAESFKEADEISIVVPTADLDLTTEAGLYTLQRRVDRAATRICDDGQTRGLWQLRLVNECKTNAIARTEGSQAYAAAVRNNPAALAEIDAAKAKSFAAR